jgi:Osmosensitive K+ channel histidine kinase
MSFVRGEKRLVQVIQDLSSAKSLEDIMTLVRSAAREIVHSDGATFVLKDGEFCFYADEDAISPLWKGSRFPLHSCVSGWAMLNKKSVAIDDIYQDPRIPIDAYKPTFVKSLAMVPIRKDDPIGAIGVYWAEHHETSAEELELLQALANTVSVAMENVGLYNDLQKKITDLEKANTEKDNFLMTVSHELRTPLNSILGWLDILKEDEGGTKSDQHDMALDIIERNARSQARIVEDLLDSTRIVVGRLKLDKKEVNLVEIAREAVTTVQMEAQKKELEIELLNMADRALVMGDFGRLRQVFINILFNAIKFSHHGGKIFVKVQNRGPGAEVQIQDQGIGITAEERPKIFGRFHQADSTTTRKYGGLGLGLSISKSLVEGHGGFINIFSKGENMGTTVVFSIPLVDLNKEAVSAALENHTIESIKPGKKLSGYNILAVDDDQDSLMLVEMVLKRSGAHVETANSVREAIQKTDEQKFDALVSDLSMPEEDGFSLVRKIRAGETSMPSDIPAVAVSAFTDEDNQKKAKGAGFNQLFGKPFSGPALIKTLESFGVRSGEQSHSGSPLV